MSGRQSSEYPAVQNHDNDQNIPHPFSNLPAEDPKANLNQPQQGPFTNNFQFPPKPAPAQQEQQQKQPGNVLKPAISPIDTTSADVISPLATTSRTSSDNLVQSPSQEQRPKTRGGFTRTMSNLFSRKASTSADSPQTVVAQSYNGDSFERRWSMARSSGNTPQATAQPSPTSPGEDGESRPPKPTFSTSQDAPQETLSKKNRASTGINFRSRAVNFATGRGGNKAARSSSFDHGNKRPDLRNAMGGEPIHNRQVLYMNADQGVGVKARRLSLSLPDDFQVDVGDLNKEFENQHKLFGRHRDGIGKGATSKVRVMARKGFPTELYAVKEFRGKSSSETKEEYEKKVKSEFSIAKSLHHPNIIETVRLCVDHGRWNHVMEYCSEGDLFTLIKKQHLKDDRRQPDRMCLFKQLIQGLAYLHANGIAHRDVKLENLLITKDSKLKITDFGVSEVFTGIHPGTRESGGECGKQMGEIRLCNPGICGSEPYIAPEVIAKKDKYDPRGLDVWGAGIVLITLSVHSTLWSVARYSANNNYTQLVDAFDKWNATEREGDAVISENDYPHYPVFDKYINPPALRRVMLMMLNPDPNKRATIDEVLNYRWIKNIECCQLDSYDDPAIPIDATKKMSLQSGKGVKKLFCHNHLPPPPVSTHSLGKMPGQAGY